MNNKSFLLDPDKWLGGTQDMSFAEQGAYLNLLIYQWKYGKFFEKNSTRLVGKFLWNNLKKKFTCEDGLWFNEKLEEERAKVLNYSNKQSAKGKQSASKRFNNNSNRGLNPVPAYNKDNNIDNTNKGYNGLNQTPTKPHQEHAQILRVDDQFLLQAARANQKAGHTPTRGWVLTELDRFTARLSATGEPEKTLNDFRSHFIHWLSKQQPPKIKPSVNPLDSVL